MTPISPKRFSFIDPFARSREAMQLNTAHPVDDQQLPENSQIDADTLTQVFKAVKAKGFKGVITACQHRLNGVETMLDCITEPEGEGSNIFAWIVQLDKASIRKIEMFLHEVDELHDQNLCRFEQFFGTKLSTERKVALILDSLERCVEKESFQLCVCKLANYLQEVEASSGSTGSTEPPVIAAVQFLEGCKHQLVQPDLTQMNLSAAKFNGAKLHNAKFDHTKFCDADLRDAEFENSTLNADFSGADLRGVKMKNVDLMGAKFNKETQFDDKSEITLALPRPWTNKDLRYYLRMDHEARASASLLATIDSISDQSLKLRLTRQLLASLRHVDTHIVTDSLVVFLNSNPEFCNDPTVSAFMENKRLKWDFQNADLRGINFNGLDLMRVKINGKTRFDDKSEVTLELPKIWDRHNLWKYFDTKYRSYSDAKGALQIIDFIHDNFIDLKLKLIHQILDSLNDVDIQPAAISLKAFFESKSQYREDPVIAKFMKDKNLDVNFRDVDLSGKRLKDVDLARAEFDSSTKFDSKTEIALLLPSSWSQDDLSKHFDAKDKSIYKSKTLFQIIDSIDNKYMETKLNLICQILKSLERTEVKGLAMSFKSFLQSNETFQKNLVISRFMQKKGIR